MFFYMSWFKSRVIYADWIGRPPYPGFQCIFRRDKRVLWIQFRIFYLILVMLMFFFNFCLITTTKEWWFSISNVTLLSKFSFHFIEEWVWYCFQFIWRNCSLVHLHLNRCLIVTNGLRRIGFIAVYLVIWLV